MRRKDRLFEVERERGRLVRELLARPSIEHNYACSKSRYGGPAGKTVKVGGCSKKDR